MEIELSEGIELFNNSDFFAAHDFFEEKWNECDQKDRLFYQGLVQVSVACYHLICGNYKGSFNQFKKCKEKFVNYLPSYKKINIDSLLNEVNILMDDLILYSNDTLERIDQNKLPTIKFI